MIQSEVNIDRASQEDAESIACLFDEYRQFYGQTSDLKNASEFIRQRLEKRDSTIFLACSAAESIGFIQLYPSYSSISMKPIWILNDLYVRREFRNKGVAAKLIGMGLKLGIESGAKRLVLSTARSNGSAQALYNRLGWKQDDEFLTYSFELETKK